MVKVYDDHKLIDLQTSETNGVEGSNVSSRFEVGTIGYMEKLMASKLCVSYLKKVLSVFIKAKYASKRIFTHFQVEVFENVIYKNTNHMIKIITLDGSYNHSCHYKNP